MFGVWLLPREESFGFDKKDRKETEESKSQESAELIMASLTQKACFGMLINYIHFVY